MSFAHRQTLLRFVLHLISILALFTLLLTKMTLPASSDPGDDGRWIWDDEHERKIFIPEDGRPRRARPSIAADAEPNGVTFPTIEADPDYEWVYGWDWTIGSTVHLCIATSGFAADPTIPAQCDLFYASMAAYAPIWDPTFGMVDFDVSPTLDLQGGQYISMTDTVTTKQHLVTNLTVTSADAVADTVNGTTDPGSLVEVYEYDGGNWLYPVADGTGNWVADFSGLSDLIPGSAGFASQDDADGDETRVYWELLNPTIHAESNADYVRADDWMEGATLHLCVDDTEFAADPTDSAQRNLYYESQVVGPPSTPSSPTYVWFYLSGSHDLAGGDYITMTDGTSTKEHQVTSLIITDVDPVDAPYPGADTVAGDMSTSGFLTEPILDGTYNQLSLTLFGGDHESYV